MTKPTTHAHSKIAIKAMRSLRDIWVPELQSRWERKPYLRAADLPELDNGPITDNPFWEIIRLVPIEVNEPGTFGDHYELEWYGRDGERPVVNRHEVVKLFTWAVLSPADLAWINDQLMGRNVIEIGAGAGYWAWQISQLGVDVMAYDNWSWEHEFVWYDVLTGEPEYAGAFPDRVLVLVWPPYDDAMAVQTLRAYTGDTLIYAGENGGGCTGDDSFHELLEQEWDYIGDSPGHVTFEGIHCHLTAYRRKAA